MKNLSNNSRLLVLIFIYFLSLRISYAQFNQTDELNPVLSVDGLPFRVLITQAPFQLPAGIHSGVVGVSQGLWVFIAGRINGLHGFNPDNNFPPDSQNTRIYVFNPKNGAFASRSLSDPTSGLNQQEIDILSVTAPQGYQKGRTLYMTGGYGIDTASGTFNTKPVLTAIYLPGIINWVTKPFDPNQSVIKNIRQIFHPLFQVTGGDMFKMGDLTLLVFGQNFNIPYTNNSNGIYTEQVRRFRILDDGKNLSVDFNLSQPYYPDPNYRRRDLNIVPFISNGDNGLIAFAGVFTPLNGVWTVPVLINKEGFPIMANAGSSFAFKQAMNQYACATVGLYSKNENNMYNIFFGGISYGFFKNGQFQTDSEIPFINDVTTIKMDKYGIFTQYLMNSSYPVILSQQSNPGNQLLFGANAYFMLNKSTPHYHNGILNLDEIKKPTLIGYIVGGIQSTLPNTNTMSDSAASPYIFAVTLIPL